jgi:hypothetical protein
VTATNTTPVRPDTVPSTQVATITVPVDLWDANSDRWAFGSVECKIVRRERVGSRAGDITHHCVPVSFTGEIRKWTLRGGFSSVSTHAGCPLDPTCEGTTDGDPELCDSINNALVEFVRDAVKIAEDLDRSRAVLAAAEAIKAGMPEGAWL